MKKQKLIAVAILFALISASALNRAIAGDAFSELQNMVKNSNSAIAFDGAKVYSNSVSDSIVELEGPDYDKKDGQTTDSMEEESGINSAYSKVLSNKVPTLRDSTDHHHYFHDDNDNDNNNYNHNYKPKKPWREQTGKEKVKTVVREITMGGMLGAATIGLFAGLFLVDIVAISAGAGWALGVVGGAAAGAALALGSYFYNQW